MIRDEGRSGRRSAQLALTFDTEHADRPDARPTGPDAILDLLGAAGIRATFFLQGRWVEANPATSRRIVDEGHVVGNHSYFHTSLPLLTPAGFEADIAQSEHAIRDLAGVDPRPWFRCPFGDGADDDGVLSRLAALGYRHVGWDVDTLDWQPGRTAQAVEAAVLDAIGARLASVSGRSNVVALLHGWPAITPVALEALIPRSRDSAVSFVAIDELADADLPAGIPTEETLADS